MKINIEEFVNLSFGYAAVGEDRFNQRQMVLWTTIRGTLEASKKASETISARFNVIGFVKCGITPLEIVNDSLTKV